MGKREDVEAFERACSALAAKEIGQGEYLRRTRQKWRLTARYLYEHYRRKLPAWVEAADVEQELVQEALKAFAKWDARRATGTVAQFVEWGATKRTRRILDHWRGASTHGASNKAPSRCEIAFARAFTKRDEEGGSRDPLDRLAPEPPSQEEELEREERFGDTLSEAETVAEALVLMALKRAAGSVRLAASLLYGDFAARVECGLASEARAQRLVGECVSVIAAREYGIDRALLPPEDLFAEEPGEDAEEVDQEERAERAA